MKTINNFLFCKIPILVKSKHCISNNDVSSECKYDTGGYSIINGNEKVIITQERVIPNVVQVYKNTSANSKYSFIGEIKSCGLLNFGMIRNLSIKITSKSIYDNLIYISCPHIKK